MSNTLFCRGNEEIQVCYKSMAKNGDLATIAKLQKGKYLFSKDKHQEAKSSNIIVLLIAALLFNVVMPTLASITSPKDKILVCSQSGFEWVSVNQQELQYLELARQLNLDIEQIWGDELPDEQASTPHGKCALCFFEQTDLLAIPANELTQQFSFQSVVVFTDFSRDLYAKGKYINPPNRAPPHFI